MTQGLIAGIYHSITSATASPNRSGWVEQARAKYSVAKNYVRSYRRASQQANLFEDVRAYCLFVGHARSGGSLLGGLLDAHPNAVIADEVDIFPYLSAGFSRQQVFHVLLERSQQQAQAGRAKAGRETAQYSYQVPDQWQGRYETLQVIGNRKAGISTQQLRRSPEQLERLQQLLGGGITLKVLLTIRNPYDTISTMYLRTGRELQKGFEVYFANCETIEQLQQKLPAADFWVMRHEQLLANPQAELGAACRFLGIPALPDYLDACAQILYSSPAKSRSKVEWSGERIRAVSERISQYAFLQGYSYDE